MLYLSGRVRVLSAMILSVCLTCAALDLCAAEERGNPSRYGMLLKSQVTVWVQRKYSATTFDPIIGKMLRPASVHPERKAGAGMELLRSIDGDFFINPPPVRNNRLESPGHPNWTTSFGFFAQRGWARRSALFGAAKTSFRTFAQGEPGDREAGLLADCGKALPFIDQAVFTREKEAIPYWNKFLQGYFDASGISSDSFDQAVRVNVGGDVALTDEMRDKGIRLLTSVKTSTFYMGFNMLDPVIGGLGERAAKLRQAISIAIDQEEFISIFQNGRGIAAQSPLPPGIFGYEAGEAGINRVVYDWVDGKARRKPVEVARQLVAEAGYPNGRDAKTGEALVVNLDTTSGGMGEKSRLDWLTRQFAKIDIQLVIRSTDFNRFQDKLRKGNVQLYYLGWNADYPDPENFFFLLNGDEARVGKGGENSSNYANPEFDRLFAQMKNMDNTPERLAIVRQMNRLLQHDAPWVFGLHPKSYTLGHRWLKNRKPNDVGNNILKYQRIDPAEREAARQAWNRPVLWPLAAGFVLLALVAVPALLGYRRRERRAALR
mgnify:CR=1 FL=1